ncbi:MAG: TMEM175 family protein [Bacteroidota bacterium]|nr:TMEM175 family protein [Bacteroidota bacterium]
MQEPKHDVERMGFQVERFITFSDGVFAIVITLMVFELKVPDLKNDFPVVYSDSALWKHLSEMGFKFLGFFISYGIVGYYWYVHHRIFGYAVKYTTKLLWINFGYLFTVAVLPFSSALLGDYSTYTNMRLPYGLYSLNMCLAGLMNYWLWIYISNPKRDLLTRKISKARIRLGVYRSLVIPVVFVLSFVVSLFFPVTGRFIILLIPAILLWGTGGLEKLAEIQEATAFKKYQENPNVPEEDKKEAV